MEEKRRSKRPKPVDDGSWDCSVCTFKNSQEAFKCEMCDVRKGTSTRKPRLNAQLVAQQVAQQFAPPPKKESLTPPLKKDKKREGEKKCDSSEESGPSTCIEKKEKKEKPSTSTMGQPKKSNRPPRLKNIDRSTGQSMEVTYGNVTVIITDYKPKKEKNNSQDSQGNSNSSQSNTSQSTDKSDKNIVSKQELNGDIEMGEKS